jgi:hypothetical protein
MTLQMAPHAGSAASVKTRSPAAEILARRPKSGATGRPPTDFLWPANGPVGCGSLRTAIPASLSWENGADDGNRTRTVSLGS